MVINADCVEHMNSMPPNSIDSIVTDPPYGLEFMGKEWDRLRGDVIADPASVGGFQDGAGGNPFSRSRVRYGRGAEAQSWHYAWAVEALRVAKPGAHLLAFGGTRTFHRLAVAIEDAGWEIRDTVMYVYGSGFPKSLNIGCKCGKDTVPYTHGGTQPKSQRDVRSVREADVSAAMDTSEGRREVLQPRLSEQGASITGRAESSTAKVWSGQLGMEGRGNVLAEARQLQADQVREMPAEVFADGATGRLHHGTPPANGVASRAHANENRSSSPQEPRSARQHNRKLGTVRKQQRAQEGGVAEDQVCEICGGLKQWAGWGTALKPAWEPIIVARKPLEGTVAANVLAHGTGAMNIDGCRVEINGPAGTWGAKQAASVGYGWGSEASGFATQQHAAGRWPANLIHDGSDEVLAGFPQSKDGVAVRRHGAQNKNPISFFGNRPLEEGLPDMGYGGSGSAARFFYCAKASKADRDEGNMHPTVKPTALMRYLCKLVTPPAGTVLDPFMGSGSTGKAAVLDGFGFIGIEQDAEYIDIARARIAHAVQSPAQQPLHI